MAVSLLPHHKEKKMADIAKVVDGKLEITSTAVTTIETLDQDAVTGKIAEIQTKIDHLKIDLVAEETEKAKWVKYLANLSK